MTVGSPKWGVPETAWTEDEHLAFRVYVAQEHLRDRMPIVELHRNHDIPLSRVRAWIATFVRVAQARWRRSSGQSDGR